MEGYKKSSTHPSPNEGKGHLLMPQRRMALSYSFQGVDPTRDMAARDRAGWADEQDLVLQLGGKK